MGKRGFALIEIMAVVGIIALLSAIATPGLLGAKKTANESAAKATVRSLSSAAETYSIPHGSTYPEDVSSLAEYLTSANSYCADAAGTQTAVQGYNYACTMSAGGYIFEASPVSNSTGSVIYTATTGGVLTP